MSRSSSLWKLVDSTNPVKKKLPVQIHRRPPL
jgi:hypothetical protein